MSYVSFANDALCAGQHERALRYYKLSLRAIVEGVVEVSEAQAKHVEGQIAMLNEMLHGTFKASANVVLTAANAAYFQSLLVLLESLKETSDDVLDEILVFDFGLEPWQVRLISQVDKVVVFSGDTSTCEDTRLRRFDVRDSNTYFFKVYAFVFWQQYTRLSSPADVNVLWIDAGVKIQKTLLEVFSLIDRDGYFFVDHADVSFFYGSSTAVCLVNSLSPSLTCHKEFFEYLSPDQLLAPVVKANFFGLRRGGEYEYLVEQFYEFCVGTDVLFDPRVIEDKGVMEFWLRNFGVKEAIKNQGIDNSGLYFLGRHEQSVWSYLVVRDGLRVHNTHEYSFTVAPGSAQKDEVDWRWKIERLLSATKNISRSEGWLRRFLDEPYHEGEKDTPGSYVGLMGAYMELGRKVYFSDPPKYQSVGFPHPDGSQYACALLHRGSVAKWEQYKYSGRLINHFSNVRDDIFILLGNGPSLANVSLSALTEHHTFGLNAAYRAYERIGFWPKYFGCFDALVCGHHAPVFKDLIRSSPIEGFFFINFDDEGNLLFAEDDIQANPRFQYINFKYRTPEEKRRFDILATTFDSFIDMRTSGPNALQVGLLLGYRKFIMLGVDQNYVEVVEGAATNNHPNKLIMEKTPSENPNYWFSDYQVAGDRFNRPGLSVSQVPSWNNFSMTLDTLGIKAEIYNCSPISTLECFQKSSLDEALKRLTSVKARELPAFKSPLRAVSAV